MKLIVLITIVLLQHLTAGAAMAHIVHLSVAASMTDAFSEIVAAFSADHEGVEFLPTFAGSGSLARQVELGAPADIYVSANPQWLPDATVASVMKRGTITVAPGTPLKQVAAVMMENGIRTLPVTDKNRDMLGVVRLMDVLVYLDSAQNETGKPFAE